LFQFRFWIYNFRLQTRIKVNRSAYICNGSGDEVKSFEHSHTAVVNPYLRAAKTVLDNE
jgi:hypothetical protein